MIRIFIGFLIVLGSIGHLETEPSADPFMQMMIAILGVIIMAFGVLKIHRN